MMKEYTDNNGEFSPLNFLLNTADLVFNTPTLVFNAAGSGV